MRKEGDSAGMLEACADRVGQAVTCAAACAIELCAGDLQANTLLQPVTQAGDIVIDPSPLCLSCQRGGDAHADYCGRVFSAVAAPLLLSAAGENSTVRRPAPNIERTYPLGPMKLVA